MITWEEKGRKRDSLVTSEAGGVDDAKFESVPAVKYLLGIVGGTATKQGDALLETHVNNGVD
ncbi:hypothetical protein RUM43_010127 [Polyplax serrata]|uniref:Uncharacterized protein n=1 Tax=Polyplax serrata TaxID=468196 RepID=A0AAN8PVG1_POLSC